MLNTSPLGVQWLTNLRVFSQFQDKILSLKIFVSDKHYTEESITIKYRREQLMNKG